MHFLIWFALIGICILVAPYVIILAIEIIVDLLWLIKWLAFLALAIGLAYTVLTVWPLALAVGLCLLTVLAIQFWPVHHRSS